MHEGKSQGSTLSWGLYSCFIKRSNKSIQKIWTLFMKVLHTNENKLLKNSRRQDVRDSSVNDVEKYSISTPTELERISTVFHVPTEMTTKLPKYRMVFEGIS